MARRLLWLLAVALVGLALLYISRFWTFDLWSREGLFGWRALPPRGNLLANWLRGTPARPFDLILWSILVFLVLTLVEKIHQRLK